MIPLQTLSNPAMALAILGILVVLAIFFGFIWAYSKIRKPPESHDDEDSGNGAHA
jgi:hypothetical protein